MKNRAEVKSPFARLSSPVSGKNVLLKWEPLQSRAVETHSWKTEKSGNGVKHDMTEMGTFRPLDITQLTCSPLAVSNDILSLKL